MPIYDYECRCGEKFEAIRKISERDNQISCPNKDCHWVGFTKRTVTAPGFVHGGFYDSLTKKA